MTSKIIFNGASYDSVDEMPPAVREAYEKIMGVFADKNQDGMPDVFESLAGTGTQNLNAQSNSAAIVYEGRQYTSLDDLPPEARQKYEQAMGNLDHNRNMIPDFLERKAPINQTTQDSTNFGLDKPLRTPPQPASQTIEPESTPARSVILTIGLATVLCIFAALTFYFLNQ